MKYFASAFYLLLLSIPVTGNAAVAIRQDLDNPAQQRLEGEWRLVRELTERLNGTWRGGPETVTISLDFSIAQELPAPVATVLGGRWVDLAGTLTFAGQKFLFLLTEKDGAQRLLCYSPSGEVILWMHFSLVPARQPGRDLLFLGGEAATHPFFAYELALDHSLTGKTKALLEKATRVGGEADEALKDLAESMEWQEVIEVLEEEIRRDPQEPHNNRLIALGMIVSRHLKDVRLDLDPLIALLRSPIWTNRQKAADVLAIAIGRPELFAGKEEAVVRALIPLTTSQRGPVVQPALKVLRALTGQERLARDPSGWVEWYKRAYGEQISLLGSVHELLGIIRAAPEARTDGLRYSLNGSPFVPVSELSELVRDLKAQAQRLGVEANFVAIVPFEITSASTRDEAFKQTASVREALARLGISDLTVASASNNFYPLFDGGLPHSVKSTSPGGGG